ncbi:hypothetical protein C0Z16_27995 [Paraburkholderia rhynchosiae]|nr:hypothetical protein C0Z16_27995 [Paraburkholderia rhynchosiae]
MTWEARIVWEMWPNGASLEDIAARLPGRSTDAIAEFRDKNHMRRKPGCFALPHQRVARDRMNSAIKLSENGLTINEIVEKAKVSKCTVLDFVKEMHGNGLYVAGYRKTTRKPAALWKLGNLPDASYPYQKVVGPRTEARLRREVNPFLTAAGFVRPPPVSMVGRVYQQSMSITDDEMEAA